jgi:hypothetical protein
MACLSRNSISRCLVAQPARGPIRVTKSRIPQKRDSPLRFLARFPIVEIFCGASPQRRCRLASATTELPLRVDVFRSGSKTPGVCAMSPIFTVCQEDRSNSLGLIARFDSAKRNDCVAADEAIKLLKKRRRSMGFDLAIEEEIENVFMDDFFCDVIPRGSDALHWWGPLDPTTLSILAKSSHRFPRYSGQTPNDWEQVYEASLPSVA